MQQDTNTRRNRSLLGASLGAALVLSGLLPAVPAQQAPGADPGYKTIARPFLDKYCIACHSGDKAKGTFRADGALTPRFSDRTIKGKWAEVVNQLNSHLMPPKETPQPTPTEVSMFMDWVSVQTKNAEETLRDRAPVMRRLTREEYKNSLRDLTGVDFDTSGFPTDPSAGGFDNNARALTVSPLHIELYAVAAKQVLDRALVDDSQPRPEKIVWRFDPKATAMDARRVKLDAKNNFVIVNGGKNTEEGEWVVVHHESWDKGVDARNFAVPIEGTYTIRLRASGRIPSREQVTASAEKFLAFRRDEDLRKNPNGAKYHQQTYQRDLLHFQTDPMYNYGSPRVKLVQHLGSQPRTVAEFDVDAAPKTYEFPVRFTTQSAGLNFHYAYDIPRVLENAWCQSHENFARPELLIDWFELEGPVYDAWPPSSHSKILFPSPLRQSNERAYAKEVVARFLRQAYRRPIAETELTGKLALFDQARQGQSFVEAIKAPLTAVLASPHFLFLMEPVGKLSDHALAARLSYFLWGTQPDPTLSLLADTGKLHEPATLRSQTNRLLADPRASEFVRRFAGQWLGLGQVGANPPATDLYPGYDRHFELSIVRESEAFFAEILTHDLDALNLIKSNFVVINERLARAYGIPGVKGDSFRRVAVPPGVHRGGVPTQASILTTTSNGTRTSPVKRGTWIMKTLLNADPGLPVANAGEIAARVPGIEKATVRKRLEIHRTRPQCARCHSHIDPLGFSLENFDASGAWREREGFGYKGRVEQNDPLIDASSSLPDGTKITGVDGLQDALLAQSDAFLTCLATKILTFALGRELSLADRPLVQGAVVHMKHNKRTLRALIEYTITSEAFRIK
ncbi:DUF1592 domain-containing protein [Armatimonas sp.]|uniref:DUF1592 domain-containing protein n=1 Tax=Armatimonas sp. TaxID=1872638 RepID=UPI003752FE91